MGTEKIFVILYGGYEPRHNRAVDDSVGARNNAREVSSSFSRMSRDMLTRERLLTVVEPCRELNAALYLFQLSRTHVPRQR